MGGVRFTGRLGRKARSSVVAVVALLAAGSATLAPAAAAPPPAGTSASPANTAAEASGSGVAGQRVVPDQQATVDMSELAAAAPAAPSAAGAQPVDVPRGDAPPDPTGAPPAALIRPDTTEHPADESGPTPEEGDPNAPVLTGSFTGTGDTGWLPPDTDGAVGPNHVVTAINGGFMIQTRAGTSVSQVTLNAFWASVLPSGNTFDPRITYDRFNNRWITVALDNGGSALSGLLLGVSSTSDPTGTWILRRYDTDADNNEWADFPTLGFNKNWITIGLNMFQIGGNFTRPQIYAIDKAGLYAGGAGSGVFWGSLTDTSNFGFTMMPATTDDNTTDTQYIARRWGQSGGNGYLALNTITGAVASPTLSNTYAFPEATGAGWSGTAAATNSAPQLGGNPVNAGDDRLHTVIFRNGKLWISHHVFLPAGAPTRAAAQWWSVTASTGAVLQRGRVDSGTSTTWFTYPTLAVNSAEDMLIGYSRFSTTQYPSANYSFRYGTDTINTTQGDTVMKAGEANYVKFDSASPARNRWGDYSSTQVDPTNDTDFWTIQEYAESPSSAWGTWWGRVTPTLTAPANDAFASATVLPSASGTTNGTNVGATKEPGEPNHAASNAGGGSVWYRFTAPVSGAATVDTAGSNFDTLLGVYTGSAVNGLTLVANNDDVGGGNTTSAVQFNAVAGTTYRIAVDGFDNVRGNVGLNWNFPTQPTGVSGTVSETGTGTHIAGAWVAVLRTADFSMAAGAVANANGDYSANVPAGTYYLYLVDPTGAHTSRFFGPPTTVTVNAGAMTDIDPNVPSTRGSLTGTVTETGTGTPIGGALALALSSTTGAVETGVVANGSGQFTVSGMAAGQHYAAYIDPTGNHATRFFPNSATFDNATPLSVTAGGSTAASASLPVQTGTGTGATLSGTVTESGTGANLQNVIVIALNAADFRLARATMTNASGAYSMNVAVGAYKLAFIDSTGLHAMEWHNNQPSSGLGNATTVNAPATTNAVLDRTTGSFSGTVTDDPSGTPLSGAWVIAIGPSGIAGGAVTSGAGTYTISGLPAGTYRATFADPNGGRRQEYWDNSLTFEGATAFAVTGGGTSTRNAALAVP